MSDDLGMRGFPKNSPQKMGIEPGGMHAQPIQIIARDTDYLPGGFLVISRRPAAAANQ